MEYYSWTVLEGFMLKTMKQTENKYCMASLICRLPRWFSGNRICLPVQERQETQVRSLGWEDSLEEEMATHSSIFAWKIPSTEEPGRPYRGPYSP